MHSSAVIAVQNILLAAAKTGPFSLQAKTLHDIVGRFLGSSHDTFMDVPRSCQSFHHAFDHGLARQIQHDFAGQATAPHAGLHDRDDLHDYWRAGVFSSK